MKIERNITVVKTTTEEASDSLRIYQQDMIHQLWMSYKEDHYEKPGYGYVTQREFMRRLLDGPDTDWFQDLIEKYHVHWIDQPAYGGRASLIERFPGVFFPGDVLDQAEQNTQFFLDDRQLSTELILNNF